MIGRFVKSSSGISSRQRQKDIVVAHAQERRESFNGFVNRAIDETIERDKEGRRDA